MAKKPLSQDAKKQKIAKNSLTEKQQQVLALCTKLQSLYANDFEGWVNKFIDFSGLKFTGLTTQQQTIANSLTTKKRVCVAGGGGLGKTAFSALAILWFLSTHPFSKIPTTAPSGKQLNDILWSELNKWMKRCTIGQIFERRSGKLFITGFTEWYAIARTVPKDGKDINDTLAGFHADHLFIIVDEASGVPDPVFTALEGAMTDANSYILLISNPVSFGGYYYDTITDPNGKGQDYAVHFFDSLSSPLVDEKYEQSIITRYGKDSPMYRSKVLGLPVAKENSIVITPEKYEKIMLDNRENSNGKVVMSIDIGAEGSDPSIILCRRGKTILSWDIYDINDTTYLCEEAVRIYETRHVNEPFVCIADGIGVGAGVVDVLIKLKKFPVIRFKGSEAAFNSEMFKNKRAEGYFRLHKKLPDLHFLARPDEKLKKALVNTIIDYSEGLIKIEEKKKLKHRIGCSPDFADTLMMNIYVDDFEISMPNVILSTNAINRINSLNRWNKQEHTSKYSKFRAGL